MNTKPRRSRPRPSSSKAELIARLSDPDRTGFKRLEQLPNIGPSVACDLRRLGVTCPQDLLGRDPYSMFDELCRLAGQRFDPCLLDTFIAVVRFMGGERAKPWWRYTAERKRELQRRDDGRNGA